MQSEKGNTAYASTTSFVFAFTGEMEMLTRLRLWTITRTHVVSSDGAHSGTGVIANRSKIHG